MNWVTSAEGNVQDWVHVTVDQVPYCISRKKDEIQYEGTASSDLYLLLNNDKHRLNLADRASIVHRESEAGWASERPESWTVHYAGKTMKVRYDGSLESGKKAEATKTPEANAWISAKIKKLIEEGKSKEQAAAIAYSMAREKGYDVPEKKADLLDDIARNLGKTKDQLTEADIQAANEQAKQMLQNSTPASPVAPALDPSMTPPSNMPSLPGQSSMSVRWFRGAGENPFGDEDGDDKDEKDEKDDKPEDGPKPDKAPKEDKPEEKEDDGDDSAGEAKDIKDTEKAIKLLEKVLKHEKGEGEMHAEELVEALELLKKFLGEEDSEPEDGEAGPEMPGHEGIPVAVDLEVMPDKPGMSPVMPMGPMSSSWTQENTTGFREKDRVWHRAFLGSGMNVGDEPGRVIAIGGGKVIVDWGHEDGIPTEELPENLVKATAEVNEATLFSSTNAEVDEAVPSAPEFDEKTEIEKILSGLSLKDIMNKASSGGSNPNAIVHIATGKPGVFLANASDGRCLIRIGNEELFVWQYEVRFQNNDVEEI